MSDSNCHSRGIFLMVPLELDGMRKNLEGVNFAPLVVQ